MLGYFFIFCALLALLQLIARASLGRHTPRHRYLLLTLASLGYILYFAGTLVDRTVFPQPAWLHWHLPVLFTLGPAIHYFLKFSLLPDEDVPLPVIVLQWLPAVLCLFYVASPLYPERHLSIAELRENFSIKSYDVHDLLAMLAFVFNIGYYLYSAYAVRFVFRLPRAELSGIRLYIIIFVVGSIVTPIIALASIFLHSIDLLSVSCTLIALSVVFGYVASIRYPEFFLPLQEEARHEKYFNSQLRGIDTERIAKDLTILLSEERVWLDDRFSLKKLAQLLRLTPHQLSEYINGHLQKNFSVLMNEYRVAEAKRMLRENSEITVIEVAFASGFGTKSNFNSVFFKAMQMTPLQYRRSQNQKTIHNSMKKTIMQIDAQD